MHVCMIDENSHYSQQATEVAARIICFLLENVHPSKVFAKSSVAQEPDRKNLAVHVSLSSIFTMSKN